MKRTLARRAFTIVEVMITCLILLILFGMILEILVPAGNLLYESSVKTELQQLGQLAVNQMVLELGQTPPTGVSLSPTLASTNPTMPANTPMIMGINPIFSTDSTTGTPVYQSNLILFYNDPLTGYLLRKTLSSPLPGGTLFSASTGVQLDPTTLASTLTPPNGTERRLAHNVQSFMVSEEDNGFGPQIYRISLTLVQDLPGTQRKAQTDILRKVFLRNH